MGVCCVQCKQRQDKEFPVMAELQRVKQETQEDLPTDEVVENASRPKPKNVKPFVNTEFQRPKQETWADLAAAGVLGKTSQPKTKNTEAPDTTEVIESSKRKSPDFITFLSQIKEISSSVALVNVR